jgi:hypothetical protein
MKHQQGRYIYNIQSAQQENVILNKQPKTYMNTEFGISVSDVLEAESNNKK